jgi:two-component system response regulator HydG
MKPILVVDDDRSMAKTVCDILRRRGWTPTEVHSGEAAVQATAKRRYAAVLMDVKMPGMNGVEAFRAIQEAQPGTPVILMTAYAAPHILAQAEQEGVLRILPKPIPWQTLTTVLDEIREWDGSVLVVDDDPAFLETLEAVLDKAGHQVRRARSMSEAVLMVAMTPPAAVVLDLALEGPPPRESVAALRRVSPTVILILCSGHPQLMEETMAAVPRHWIYARLIKPFPPDHLLHLLDAATVT